MGFLVPPTGVEPRSVLSESPLRRMEQLKALYDAQVIDKEQLLRLFDEEPKCPHGVKQVDCGENDCAVDWVHAL